MKKIKEFTTEYKKELIIAGILVGLAVLLFGC